MKQKYFISTNLLNNMFIIFYLTLIYLSTCSYFYEQSILFIINLFIIMFIFLRTNFKFSKLDLVLIGQ